MWDKVLYYAAAFAVAVVAAYALQWLFGLGAKRPGELYAGVASTIVGAVFVVFFIGLAAMILIYPMNDKVWWGGLAFVAAGIWFGYMTVDSATFRLRYDASGFTLCRWLRTPITVRWDQVVGLRHTGHEWLLELDHPDKRTLTLWTTLVGIREFLSELQSRARAR